MSYSYQEYSTVGVGRFAEKCGTVSHDAKEQKEHIRHDGPAVSSVIKDR